MSAAQVGASVRFCGRDFSPAELARIRFLIAQGQACRSQLARQVCQEFGWLNAQGRLKEMSCKVALLRMQRAGLLVLPGPRGRNGNGNGKKRPLAQKLLALEPLPLTLAAHQLQALRLELVRTAFERLLYRQMMGHHHYLGYYPMAGAQLRYLLLNGSQLLGGLGFGASAWSLAARDGFIGWSGAPNANAICTWCSTISAFCCCRGCVAPTWPRACWAGCVGVWRLTGWATMATGRSCWRPSSNDLALAARLIGPPTGTTSGSPEAGANWRNATKASCPRRPSSFIPCVPISKRSSHAEPHRLHRIFTNLAFNKMATP
jgi:Domain of unknown function (DUF4338)